MSQKRAESGRLGPALVDIISVQPYVLLIMDAESDGMDHNLPIATSSNSWASWPVAVAFSRTSSGDFARRAMIGGEGKCFTLGLLILAVSFAVVLLGLAPASSAVAETYNVTELTPLSGYANSFATDVNNLGEVIGYSTNGYPGNSNGPSGGPSLVLGFVGLALPGYVKTRRQRGVHSRSPFAEAASFRRLRRP
jgi:hypothetical protein